ncbi:uncharacterized protein LOC128547797 [Mercenaria mercenaria]|uniref:uncharacterized protein LOC128547797 n=1 Tax=Mercenaria mercenaria TaxID=6596 RepID=UPI00234E9614|nr:uncharacterized protein LOC128547797 [Mercenaria mercenaria]
MSQKQVHSYDEVEVNKLRGKPRRQGGSRQPTNQPRPQRQQNNQRKPQQQSRQLNDSTAKCYRCGPLPQQKVNSLGSVRSKSEILSEYEDRFQWTSRTADSVDKHNKALSAVLQRLRDKNLTLNKEKCEFSKSELKFMGHILSKDGIKIGDAKVRAIRDTEPPTNVTEVKSFLGLVTFCSKYIPDYATLFEPLRKFTRKKQPWVWGLTNKSV